MQPPIQKTEAEKIMGIINPIILALNFFVLPICVGLLVFFNRPGPSFGLNLLYNLGLVYVFGGFLIFSIKMWELWDNKFVLYKRAVWASGPILQKLFYKVVVPKDYSKKPAEMPRFFYDLMNVNSGLRDNYEKYVQGKWYYNLNFDIIVRNGKVEMYFSFPYKRKNMVLEIFSKRLPEITLIECEDPYKNWPTEWVPGQTKIGPYSDFYSTDYQLASPGPFALAPFTWFPDNVPMTELLNHMKHFHKDASFIVQYVFRPFPDNPNRTRWEEELKEIKKDYLKKSATFSYTNPKGEEVGGAVGDLVVQRQRDFLNHTENKIYEAHYKVHLRLMLFYPEGKRWYENEADKIVRLYTALLWGYKQGIVKDWYTATDRYYLSGGPSFVDVVLGKFMNKHYHSKEVVYRKKIQYIGLLSRDVDIAHDGTEFMVDVPSLSQLFHFPTNFGIFEEELASKPTFPNDQIQNINPNTDQNIEQTQNLSFEKLQQLRQAAIQGNPEQVPHYENLPTRAPKF